MSAHRAKSIVRRLLPVALFVPLAACSRNAVEAINIAKEGDDALKASMTEEAIGKYQQAANLDPDNHRIQYKLALAYVKKDDWPNVAATCAKAETADKKAHGKYTFATYWWQDGYANKKVGLAAMKAAQGDPKAGASSFQDAKQRLETAVSIDPAFADAYADLGEVLLYTDDEQGALQNWTKAIEAKPDRMDYYVALGNAYIDLMYLDEADAVFREGVENFAKDNDPMVVSLHMGRGNIAAMRHQVPQEIKEFEAAFTTCKPDCADHKEIFFYLGAAYADDTPPRAQGKDNLIKFQKVCKTGGAASKFQALCPLADEISSRKYGALPP